MSRRPATWAAIVLAFALSLLTFMVDGAEASGVPDPAFSSWNWNGLVGAIPPPHLVRICPAGDGGTTITVSLLNSGGQPVPGVVVRPTFTADRPMCWCSPRTATTDAGGNATIYIFGGLNCTEDPECARVTTTVHCGDVQILYRRLDLSDENRKWISIDLNGDCNVDNGDLYILTGDQPLNQCRSDLNGDLLVNLTDVGIFGNHLAHTCDPLVPVGVGSLHEGPGGDHALTQNSPNPFGPSTRIEFTLAQSGRVVLRIYDVAGRPVRHLLDRSGEDHSYEITWDGSDDAGTLVNSGVYFYRLEAPGLSETRKMVLLR